MAHAANHRYIISVEDSERPVIKALTERVGGIIDMEAKGFIAATFANRTLPMVKRLLDNTAILSIEEDVLRHPLSLFNDSVGDPMTQQITPYGYYQAQAEQITFNHFAGMKVCVIDSGLDASNTDFDWGIINGSNDTGTGKWFVLGGPHGTHVAGTIAAGDNGYGVIGMDLA